MFWGLIIEPNKRYTQTVEKSFHVSMASLDHRTAKDDIVQVILCYEDRNYLLCSLKKGSTMQVPLDLNFEEGTKIAFTCNGHGHVHLTGYMVPEDDMDLDELEEEEDDEESVPQLVNSQETKKKRPNSSPKEESKNKKAKHIKEEAEEAESSDENDSEDEDLELEEKEDDSEDEDLELEEKEDDSDNEDLEEEEDEDEQEDEEDEEEEEEEVEIKKKQQPKDKKNKQIEQQQQQQQQQKKKMDKQKMVNGKESNQDDVSSKHQKKKKEKQQQQNAQNAQNEQKKRVLEGGVQIEDVKVGTGAPAKPGKFVSVYYVGRLKNGKKFDATTQGDGFKFRLGKGEVIKGWDIGVAGMKIGGKRRITIPPALAYGAKGSPPVIPGNSTLVFEVELRNVH